MISELKRAFEIGFLLFPPFPHHRSRRGLGAHVHGHDDAAAGGGVAAVTGEDANAACAVCIMANASR